MYFFFPFLVLLAACYAAVLTGAPADRSRGGPTQTPNGREREREMSFSSASEREREKEKELRERERERLSVLVGQRGPDDQKKKRRRESGHPKPPPTTTATTATTATTTKLKIMKRRPSLDWRWADRADGARFSLLGP